MKAVGKVAIAAALGLSILVGLPACFSGGLMGMTHAASAEAARVTWSQLRRASARAAGPAASRSLAAAFRATVRRVESVGLDSTVIGSARQGPDVSRGLASPRTAGAIDSPRVRKAGNIGDPTLLAVDPADWNGTSSWAYFTGADLDSAAINPVNRFHQKTYGKSGLITNGECGQDRNGDPYSFACSGFYQSELIAIQANHVIGANYVGSLYTSTSKATGRYHDATAANGKGIPCGLANQGVPNCMSWVYSFTNPQGQTVAYGVYSALQVGNALGEMVNYISPADYNNGSGNKAQTFFHDVVDLFVDSASLLQFRSNSGKNAITSPLATAVPFSVWPTEGVAKQGTLKPSDADKAGLNPLTKLHSKTYVAAGMLSNGNCGVDSNGHRLPKKCGGVLEQEMIPIGGADSHTFTTTYVGTLYSSAAKALAHLKDSAAAKGTACPFTIGGASVPNCKFVSTTVTSGSGQKQERLYGVLAVGNALGEVLTTAQNSDYKNAGKQAATRNGFFSVLYGAATTL